MRCIVITTLIALTLAACGDDDLYRIDQARPVPAVDDRQPDDNDAGRLTWPVIDREPEPTFDAGVPARDAGADTDAGDEEAADAGISDDAGSMEPEEPDLPLDCPVQSEVHDLGRGYAPRIAFDEDGLVVSIIQADEGVYDHATRIQSFDYDMNPRIDPYTLVTTHGVTDLAANDAGFLLSLPNDYELLQLDQVGNPVLTAEVGEFLFDALGAYRRRIGNDIYLSNGSTIRIGDIHEDLSLEPVELVAEQSDPSPLQYAKYEASFSDDPSMILARRMHWTDESVPRERSLIAFVEDAPDVWTPIMLESVMETFDDGYNLWFHRGVSLEDGRRAVLYTKSPWYETEERFLAVLEDGDVVSTEQLTEQIVDVIWDGETFVFLHVTDGAPSEKVIAIFRDDPEDTPYFHQISLYDGIHTGARFHAFGERVYVSWWDKDPGDENTLHGYLAEISCSD